MALVLSAKRGFDFYVADRRYVVEDVIPIFQARVRCPDGRVVTVETERPLAVEPDVTLQVGNAPNGEFEVRLLVEAPQRLRVLRGAALRRGRPREEDEGVL